MKIPAFRAHFSDKWTYYVSTFTFAQVSQLVKRIDKELHQSEGLRDQIQRSISENFISIKNYILNQEEHFFNALVLAIYDGDPKWIEVELSLEDETYSNIGFLELTGEEKIFPVDGQHRVEGIKAVVKEKPELGTEKIAVIFIGHKNTPEGMQKSRRLFTTLNRYAKPVKENDIIALDEDDVVAITTRELLETFPLFTGKRVNNAKQKAMPEHDKFALTSLITLYQCNIEVFKYFVKTTKRGNPTKLFLSEYLKFRPDDKTYNEFYELIFHFWKAFSNQINAIKEYMALEEEPAKPFRNREDGGNLLFRPIGLLPMVWSALEIKRRKGISFETIFEHYNTIGFQINQKPWIRVVWNPIEHKMVMGGATLIKFILLYLFDPAILSAKELKKLKEMYAAQTGYEGDLNDVLLDLN